MNALRIPLPDNLRADLRTRLARTPEPVGSRADECADLVFHAIKEATAAIDRVTASAPPDLQLAVATVAIGTAAAVFKGLDEALIGAIVERLFTDRSGVGG